MFREMLQKYPRIDEARLIHETVRRLINLMVVDLIGETRRRLEQAAPGSVEEVRALDGPVVGFSAEVASALKVLRAFLHARMYKHYKVNRMARKARIVVKDMFESLLDEPGCLPPEWQVPVDADERTKAFAIRDYIAGMTDRYALEEHDRLFNMTTH